MVLLDANVLVYYLDETSDNHAQTIGLLQRLVDDDEQLVTSHHIMEEVLFVLSKLSPDADIVRAVERIAKLPSLILVEPSPSIDFALRYAALSQKLNTGVNDALILQLMLDADIAKLFSYDKKLQKQADALHIEQIS
ncbi:MAG: type II toxin-antitoxin system VapC family toxin [Candidatus Berkelbacteria bacterium]|nr:type II toxin-antitoxin system VapC family toxin [Candidatus Berkelbacteria bacterium]MCR4307185.1 type II toxin-antitoxin system VapC family toxin [Candidatus Berkelbacteria bacterium]